MEIEDIRKKRKSTGKSFWFYLAIFWNWLKKNKWKILITVVVLFILFNPVGTATVVGNWITDFVGSLINSINF